VKLVNFYTAPWLTLHAHSRVKNDAERLRYGIFFLSGDGTA
jgi:hypothetical protein